MNTAAITAVNLRPAGSVEHTAAPQDGEARHEDKHGDLLEEFHPDECQSFFRHAGYASN